MLPKEITKRHPVLVVLILLTISISVICYRAQFENRNVAVENVFAVAKLRAFASAYERVASKENGVFPKDMTYVIESINEDDIRHAASASVVNAERLKEEMKSGSIKDTLSFVSGRQVDRVNMDEPFVGCRSPGHPLYNLVVNRKGEVDEIRRAGK